MAKQPNTNDPVHIDIEVKTDPNDLRLHAGACPVANSLALSEPTEIMYTKADSDRKEIRFSRRSTGMKYTYRMPKKVYDFIIKWDSGIVPKAIRLVLHESDLVSRKPRGKGQPNSRRKTTIKRGPRKSTTQRSMPTAAALKKATKKSAA